MPGICPRWQTFIACSYTASGEAVAYLNQRGLHSPELIEEMRISYAPGNCLRRWRTQLGYPLETQRQAGLVTAGGYDAYVHRIVFPLEGNLYGRSLSPSAPPHRFLPGGKGGLYAGEKGIGFCNTGDFFQSLAPDSFADLCKRRPLRIRQP